MYNDVMKADDSALDRRLTSINLSVNSGKKSYRHNESSVYLHFFRSPPTRVPAAAAMHSDTTPLHRPSPNVCTPFSTFLLFCSIHYWRKKLYHDFARHHNGYIQTKEPPEHLQKNEFSSEGRHVIHARTHLSHSALTSSPSCVPFSHAIMRQMGNSKLCRKLW